MLGLDGNGIDGRIGNAGVIIPGGANGTTISGAIGAQTTQGTQGTQGTHQGTSSSVVGGSNSGGGTPSRDGHRLSHGHLLSFALLALVFVL